MRNFSFRSVLSALVLSAGVAGAGLVGGVCVATHVFAADSAIDVSPTGTSRVFIDGRVPIRLSRVSDGALVPAEQATVNFVHRGITALEAVSIEGGTVQAEGLTAGAYSVIVHGRDGFATFATSINPSELNANNEILSVALVPPTDMPTVRRLLQERTQVDASTHAPKTTEVALKAARTAASVVHGNSFELSADGSLKGRVVRTDSESQVYTNASVWFVRNNRVVAETSTDDEGIFEVNKLAPAIYSLVVTTPSAYFAMSVQVAPHQSTVAGEVINHFSVVSYSDDMLCEVSPICEEDLILVEEYWVEEELLVDDEPETPCCGGAFGGTGGGYGGGGGGASGGIGTAGLILGAGALAAGIYALTDDDDNRRVVSPPAP